MTDGTPAPGVAVATDSSEPSHEELEDSIRQLADYRDRLINDVIGMGQKLKMPQKQVELTLSQHPELQRIEAILAQLEHQKADQV